jgi:NADH dehydrogenase
MLTELHEVAAGRVDEDSKKISLRRVFAGRRVNVELDTVESVDFENKVVRGKNKEYKYDYVVLAAAQRQRFTAFPARINTHTPFGHMMTR